MLEHSSRLKSPKIWFWAAGICALLLLGSLLISAAQGSRPAAFLTDPVATKTSPPPSPTFPPSPTLAPSPSQTPTPLLPTDQPNATPTREPTIPAPRTLDEWKEWPVIPEISTTAVQIYRRGIELGNDPRVFSVLGDCQSLPEIFMGVYDTQPELVAELPETLRETISNFSGSFSRLSPTTKEGATAAALLWFAWHENEFGCQPNETPLDCELRLVKPSIVFINLGTHYETRNINYLRRVIDTLIAHGALPILATKADNRELDDRLNLEMAQLALEYDLPLWNFYAAVGDLPDHGVSLKPGEEHLGVIYLISDALERHRFTALQALDAVWRSAR